MSNLTGACTRLAATLPAAWRLTPHPDTDGTRGTRQPGSRPPWNASAANAAMDAHEGLRRLETAMRLAASLPARPRGGSDANTLRAIAAIDALGSTMTTEGAAEAARILDRWAMAVGQLAAVDTVPKWERLRHGPDGLPPRCPFCECYGTLRVAVASGAVVCVKPGCADGDGQAPYGRMEIGRVSAEPCIEWRDGTTTYPMIMEEAS